MRQRWRLAPTDPEREGRGDTLLAGDADTPGPEAQTRQTDTSRWPGRPTAAGRQEQEARSLLVRMSKETTMWFGAIPDREFIHAPTLERVVPRCLTIPGNYT